MSLQSSSVQSKKGIELSIRAVVILLLAIIVFLAALMLLGSVWDISPFEHAMGNVTERQPGEDDYGIYRQNIFYETSSFVDKGQLTWIEHKEEPTSFAGEK